MKNVMSTESRTYLSTNDKTASIRASLKKLGINSRKVSVRKDGCSIRVEIRDLSVKLAAVEEIANAFENISRCHVTGEILSGGNTYVSVSYTDEALAGAVAGILPEIEAMSTDGREGYIGPFNVWRDGADYVCFVLPGDNEIPARCWGTRHGAERLAIAIANV